MGRSMLPHEVMQKAIERVGKHQELVTAFCSSKQLNPLEIEHAKVCKNAARLKSKNVAVGIFNEPVRIKNNWVKQWVGGSCAKPKVLKNLDLSKRYRVVQLSKCGKTYMLGIKAIPVKEVQDAISAVGKGKVDFSKKWDTIYVFTENPRLLSRIYANISGKLKLLKGR